MVKAPVRKTGDLWFESQLWHKFFSKKLSSICPSDIKIFNINVKFYWYIEPQQSQMRFFLIHGRHLSGRVQCSHQATTAMWTTMSSGNPIYHERHLSGHVQCSHRAKTTMWKTMSSGNHIYHERHLSGRVQCSHRATAMSNVVTGPLPTISIMRPGNPHLWATVWVQITLPSVGELKPPFWQQWFQITRNCKH